MNFNDLTKDEAARAFKRAVEKAKLLHENLTAKKMAEAAGLTYDYFNRIMYAVRKPEAEDLKKMEIAVPGFEDLFWAELGVPLPKKEKEKSHEILLAEAKAELDLIIKDRDYWRERFIHSVSGGAKK